MRDVRVAFASLHDPRDVTSGSGTPYHFTRELARQLPLLSVLEPIQVVPPLPTRVLARYSRATGRRYRSLQDPWVGRRIGRRTSVALSSLAIDCLLTNDHCVCAYTTTPHPRVLYTDAVFPLDYGRHVNPRLDNLSRVSVRFSQAVNRRSLRRCDLCVFPSRWAAEEATRYEVGTTTKTRVVPFGANLRDPGSAAARDRRSVVSDATGRIELLFVGRDWAGKGGDVAVETARELRQRGCAVVLHLVGSAPARTTDDLFVAHGLLDKNRADHEARLSSLYESASALLMPTRGEGFGVAAVEAAAYGLPVLGYDTIGLRDAVRHGRSGVLLEPGASGAAFADVISQWVADSTTYRSLVQGAREHFERDANWAMSVKRLVAEIAALLDRRAGGGTSSP